MVQKNAFDLTRSASKKVRVSPERNVDREALIDHAEVRDMGQIMNAGSGRRVTAWLARPRPRRISLRSRQGAAFR